ncbi:hypothetical protein Gotur_008615 [Gossypium turneri]
MVNSLMCLPMLVRFPILNFLLMAAGMLGLEHHLSKGGLQMAVLLQSHSGSSNNNYSKTNKRT